MTSTGVNIFWSYYLKIVNHKTDVTGGTKYLPPPPGKPRVKLLKGSSTLNHELLTGNYPVDFY